MELSWPETHGKGCPRLLTGTDDDEDDPGGGDINDEPHDGGDDDEPSLGWTNPLAPSLGTTDDREDGVSIPEKAAAARLRYHTKRDRDRPTNGSDGVLVEVTRGGRGEIVNVRPL